MSKKPSLAELRAKFKQKAEGKKEFTGNTDVYPHWNIPMDATATIRILPDKNEDNDNYFFIDKLEHTLSISGKDRKIPCIKMYGEKCPICELSSKYYKAAKAAGKEDSPEGKYYYFKRKSLMKALVIKDPIDYSQGGESAEGQVKTMIFTYQLMKLINTAIANDEEEKALLELPWDMEAGYNFLIQKTKQGQYDNYSTSAFSNRQSAIAEKYLDAVEDGRIDLRTLLPENPGLEKVQALLEAHLSGEDAEDEVEEGDAPVIAKRKQPVTESTDDDEIPVRKRKPVAEEVEEEEVPVRKRKPVVEEADEEEDVPVRKRKPVVEEEEEEAPVRKRKPAVVEEDEDEEENSDDAIMARIRARKRNTDEG